MAFQLNTILFSRSVASAVKMTSSITTKLTRISRYPDNDGELRVLDAYGFVRFDEPDEHGESAHWRVFLPGLTIEGRLVFLEFVQTNGIPLSRPLVALDFSDF